MMGCKYKEKSMSKGVIMNDRRCSKSKLPQMQKTEDPDPCLKMLFIK